MISFILVVAILNLSLGFAMAVYLGQRNPGLDSFADLDPLPLGSRQTPMASAAAPQAASPGNRASPQSAADPATGTLGSEAPEHGEAKGRGGDMEQDSASQPDRSPSQISVDEFQDQVRQYGGLLTDFDDQLRRLIENAEQEEVRSCLDSLKQANQDYLGSREGLLSGFEQLHKEREEYQAFGNSLGAVAARQSQQIASTNQAIDAVDLEADLLGGCRQIVQETGKLLEVNHQLRDTLEEVQATVARRENRLDPAMAENLNDPLTGLANRAGLASALAQWWEGDPQRLRKLTAAMLDLDQFCRVNQRHGQKAGDRLLRAVAQLVTCESQQYTVAARFAGQRFLLLFGDVDLRFTTNVIERIRQLMELAHFQCDSEEIQITLSCAVTEAGADDTPDTLLARTETTLQEAKRYGRNRTFLHEGKYPTPVVPPNFALEPRMIPM